MHCLAIVGAVACASLHGFYDSSGLFVIDCTNSRRLPIQLPFRKDFSRPFNHLEQPLIRGRILYDQH